MLVLFVSAFVFPKNLTSYLMLPYLRLCPYLHCDKDLVGRGAFMCVCAHAGVCVCMPIHVHTYVCLHVCVMNFYILAYILFFLFYKLCCSLL